MLPRAGDGNSRPNELGNQSIAEAIARCIADTASGD
jgi:hypothetical protein